MTLNTVTTQEQEMINYIEQQLKNSPTIQVAINHHLISLDYAKPNIVKLAKVLYHIAP